jgi:hypothetical protein
VERLRDEPAEPLEPQRVLGHDAPLERPPEPVVDDAVGLPHAVRRVDARFGKRCAECVALGPVVVEDGVVGVEEKAAERRGSGHGCASLPGSPRPGKRPQVFVAGVRPLDFPSLIGKFDASKPDIDPGTRESGR